MSELRDLVLSTKPTTTPLDVMPPQLIKATFDILGPFVLDIINTSLATGMVPAVFKHAVVSTLLKKQNLDATIVSSYRRISKLPFLAKLLEKVVYSQLLPFLNHNSVFETFQSGFKAMHSTESALLKVTNDLLLTVDSGKGAILMLLDLKKQWVGLQGVALKWFKSYLEDWTFSVNLANCYSSSADVRCGVPQGSILGPILFSLYMLLLGQIIRKHNVNFHFYADDIQLYLPIRPNDNGSFMSLKNCLEDFKTWMAVNFLHLNESKTELIIFGTSHLCNNVSNNLDHMSSYVKSSVRNLDVVFDTDLRFAKQINSVVKSSFFQLRNIAKLKPFLSFSDLEKVIHAFISSQIDYCNSLYIGINQSLLHHLQLVQNAACRLLTRTKKREHITPVLASLHWLPVEYRIQFKVL
uniref:Reverse transcriptase domain-containing protein n=1 Tax=Astyanax mexicanus TaxID=7994 RepID=A0A3B1JMG1_ASTMX